jgi:hypothetical protein
MKRVVPPISPTTNTSSAPRLEYYRSGSTELHRVTIEHSPFKIGRCETSDLQIDSVQVSREHAQIYQRGHIWSIRDLGSTNGTEVNGKAIQESVLSDGDILAIAETEMTFVASPESPFQRMVTQPIQSRKSTRLPALLPSEITLMRELTEAVLWQAMPLQLATVVTLGSGEAEAHFAQMSESTGFDDLERPGNATQPMGRRFLELSRLRAIEMVQAESSANRLFVTASLVEFESPGLLFSNLEQLRDQIAPDCELGVAIILPKTLDPIALLEVSRKAHEAEILLGLVNFQGSIAQVVDLGVCAPDYLILCDTMLKGLKAYSQPLSRLELVLTACQELGIKAVLPHCTCQSTIAQCRRLGYEFAVQATAMPNEKVDHSNVVAHAIEPRDHTSSIGLEVS